MKAYVNHTIKSLFASRACAEWCERDISRIRESDPDYDGEWTTHWRVTYWVAGELSRRFDRSFAWGLSQVAAFNWGE